jgi:hypothetical protein
METAARALTGLLEQELERLAEVPLAELAAGRGLAAPAEPLVLHLLAHRAALAEWLRAPERAPALCARLARFLWQKNQYVRLDRATLTAACAAAGQELAGALESEHDSKNMSQTIKEIGRGLQARVAASVQGGARPAEVVCSEYAVTLQRDALGLGDERLTPPILDLGCGRAAGLVRALRAEGLEATGLDREAPADVAIAGDWLTFPFGQERWGTIVSHQAFSLHFLHHHLAQGAEAYAYARAYMAALRSLKIGGRFVYAPGLPFIESMLPVGRYRVARVPLPAPLAESVLALEQAVGLEVGYAAHVERLTW